MHNNHPHSVSKKHGSNGHLLRGLFSKEWTKKYSVSSARVCATDAQKPSPECLFQCEEGP